VRLWRLSVTLDRVRQIGTFEVLTVAVIVSLAVALFMSWQSITTANKLEALVKQNETRSMEVARVACDQRAELARKIVNTQRILDLPNAEALLADFGYTLVEANRDLDADRERLETYAHLSCDVQRP